jgi:hypothetical protein
VSTTQKSDAPEQGSSSARDYRIPATSPWTGSWKVAAAVGAIALAAAAYGYSLDKARFAYSYLFGLFVPLSLALGSLFFVMVLYVTKAAWGVTVRRVAEFFMRPISIFALLIVPLVLVAEPSGLFPWMGGAHAAAEASKEEAAERAGEHGPAGQKAEPSPIAEARGQPAREPAAMRDLPVPNAKRLEKAEEGEEQRIVQHKHFYLNKYFFFVRLIAYLAIWSWLAWRYFRWSTEQDKTRALENTAAAQSFAPAGLILFAATITFFGFDWFLSLNATWYSTIFGVYIFAQAALFQMASLILAVVLLQRSKLLGSAVTVEHFHDMGKLLFGWIVFWSYISFAQFFLTWYSNIPDELTFFHQRWHDNGGTWKNVTLALIALHFFVPFWFLMSRNIKRRLPLLATGAVIMIVMHIVEVYWVVMPNFGPLAPSWVDLACLVGFLGVYLALVLREMESYSLVPVGDPRLVRALEFENA